MVSPERQPNIDSLWNDDMPWGPSVVKPAEELAPPEDATKGQNDNTSEAAAEAKDKPKTEWS